MNCDLSTLRKLLRAQTVNFRKCLLYKCFMSLILIVIQINIKFLKTAVKWTNS